MFLSYFKKIACSCRLSLLQKVIIVSSMIPLIADEEHYLQGIYFDPAHPASYQGPEHLYTFVKNDGQFSITLEQIKKWLQEQDAYRRCTQTEQSTSTKPQEIFEYSRKNFRVTKHCLVLF